jgi:caffeoyl-CoA O-methyltransferase
MSTSTIAVTDAIRDYLLDVTVRESPLLARLREETQRLPSAGMQISPEQGRFMAFLVELLRVRRYLEVGVFTGYSSLSVALAMPADGRIVACDRSEEWTGIARRYWKEAGVEQKIELRLGNGLESLDALAASGARGSFDFVFIDADKDNYARYYDRCLDLVRTGGLIAIDNVLWGGSVARPAKDADTAALQALNDKIHADQRVDIAMLSIGDGVTLARKR